MAEKLKSILLFGQPGVGKGTQGAILGRVPGFCHLATGDMFRGLDRDSELGREFLDLCLAFIEAPDDVPLIERAAELGLAYGKEIATRGIPLADALEAFVFFRNATTGAIKPSLVGRGASAEEAYGTLEVLSRLTDQVLLNLTAYYDQTPVLEPHQAPAG